MAEQRYGGRLGGSCSRRRKRGPATWQTRPGRDCEGSEGLWANLQEGWIGGCLKRGIPRSQANRPDSVGPALGIHPVESHLFSGVPAALPGLDELDSDTNGCTAPSAIACPGAIGAADGRHWMRSRLAGQRTSVGMSTAAAAYRGAGKGKCGSKVSFRSAPPRSTCMGNPWRPGQNATSPRVPSALPVIGQCFNDIPSFAPVCTAARSHLCLVWRIAHPPKATVPHGEAAHKAGQDHLVDEPALRRCFVTRLPRWVAKTRWIKRQPSPPTIHSFPPEIYSGHNSNGTEKRNC